MTENRIRLRAYFHSENRTGANWRDPISNWLQAEAEEQRAEVRETSATRLARRPDLAQFDVDRAMRFALYETHRFCILLPPEASLLDEVGSRRSELDNETLAVFVHEYTHFVHNISTVSGWTAYELMVNLLAAFSHTLDENGSCDPSRLSPTQHDSATTSLRALLAHEGMRALPRHPSPAVALRVLDLTSRSEDIAGIQVPISDVHWEITRRDSSVDITVGPLGSFLIEEGIAYILETSVRQGRASFDDAWTPKLGPPIFPYLAYQILCRTRAPTITPAAAVRLGLLALNFNRPGHALVRSLDMYAELRNQGHDDVAACDRLKTSVAPVLGEILERILAINLAAIPEMFRERGLLEVGARQVHTWFNEALLARRNDIWFDVDWCTQAALDESALSALLMANLPCDVIQERGWVDGERQRDALLTFTHSTPDAQRTLGGVRSLQAQLDFLLAHLTTTGFCSTVQVGAHKCPFFGFCVLPMRENEPGTCAREPWTFWRRDPTCWYGVAVAGTLNTIINGTESER